MRSIRRQPGHPPLLRDEQRAWHVGVVEDVGALLVLLRAPDLRGQVLVDLLGVLGPEVESRQFLPREPGLPRDTLERFAGADLPRLDPDDGPGTRTRPPPP